MKYLDRDKDLATKLRLNGYSFNEIADKLKIPRGTIYEWTHSLLLDTNARIRILYRRQIGIENTKKWWQMRKMNQLKVAHKRAEDVFDGIIIDQKFARIILSSLFWAEGSKSLNSVIFMNSDPKMISTFIYLLRLSYELDEKKFRVLLHLHEYHDRDELVRYWVQVTKVPMSQFQKVYLKPHTKKRKHIEYKGSCSLRYYDASIARELTAIYNTLTEKIGL